MFQNAWQQQAWSWFRDGYTKGRMQPSHSVLNLESCSSKSHGIFHAKIEVHVSFLGLFIWGIQNMK